MESCLSQKRIPRGITESKAPKYIMLTPKKSMPQKPPRKETTDRPNKETNNSRKIIGRVLSEGALEQPTATKATIL